MPAKREVVCGIAPANAYNHQPATPDELLVCESFQLGGSKKTYEQVNNMTPDNLQINSAGMDFAFDVSGCEPNVTQLGKIMAYALGGDTMTVDDEHQIIPGNGASKFLALYRDLKVDVGGSGLPTEVALGAKVASFSLEIAKNAFVKLAFSGAYCNLGAEIASLTAVAPAHPLSWHSLRAGDFKIGLNGAAVASDRTIHGFKLDYSREQNTEDNIELDNDQPNDITEGGRTFDFEITRKLSGAQSIAEYEAWKNDYEIALELELIADPDGTPQTFTLSVPHARITSDPYIQPTGTGNDPVMAILKCRAMKIGADDIMTILADDGTIVAWAA